MDIKPSIRHGKPTEARANEARRVVWATFLGTTIEWYDFFLYAACAALVFGPQFFPSDNPTAGQLGAFATFAVGFLIRPLGGALAGHFGDRIGRKKMLVLSLMVMGVATVLVGLIPTYEQIGMWAPVLLIVMRLFQGLGVGAEWGGAVTMAVEHAPENKKSLYGAAPMAGLPAGLLLANLALIILIAVTGANFTTWGWRVAFLFSFVLIVVGVWSRKQLGESPLFEESVKKAPVRVPLITLFKEHKLALVCTVFIAGVPGILSYLVLTWALTYGTTVIGYERQVLLWIGIGVCLIQIVMLPWLASLADKSSYLRMSMIGAGAMAVTAVVFFPLFSTGNVLLAVIATVVAHASTTLVWAVVPSILTNAFPVEIRYTGISMAYQFGGIIGGGIAPLIATALLASTGSTMPISLYVVVACAVMFVSIMVLRRYRGSIDNATQRKSTRSGI